MRFIIHNSKFKHLRGFTIIELIVVVGITVILSTALITYSRTQEKQIVFFREQALIAGIIQKAKAFSIETFQPQLIPLFGGTPSEKICGWGIQFRDMANGNNYTFFKDVLPVGDVQCGDAGSPKYNSPRERYEEFSIDKNAVEIESVCLNGASSGLCPPGAGSGVIDIVFIPPDPTVSFYPNSGAAEAVIVLKLAGVSRRTNLIITKSGQINVVPQ